MSKEQFIKQTFAYNVLTSSEVAELLQVSRQSINSYVREGLLEPFKNTQNGMLFYRPDIQNYLEESSKHIFRDTGKITHFSGNTRDSLKFYNDNKEYLDEVIAIFAYFDDFDAIMDGFYMRDDYFDYGELKALKCPSFILRDKLGKEMWLDGCNVGYVGEGPRGSIQIMKELGLTEDKCEKIEQYRVVKFLKNNNEWEEFLHNSLIDESPRRHIIGEPSARIFMYDNRLVLLQSDHAKWDANPLWLIEKYKVFIPNPVSISIFETNDQAKEYGYYFPSLTTYNEHLFKVIITDESGRQLWMNPNISTRTSIKKQEKIRNIIDYCGFEINDKSLLKRFLQWFDTEVNKTPPQPLYLLKK